MVDSSQSPPRGGCSQPVGDLAARFAERADISARSLLVTIFGDSIVPLGGEIWLSDLIQLCSPFQFSERLLRTSMFRLNKDGWFEVERVGRQSIYRLSPWARSEFGEAERRIYHRPVSTWDQSWTIVFVSVGIDDKQDRDKATKALSQAGYRQLVPGLMATPSDTPTHAAQILDRIGLDKVVPVASARFDDLAPLIAATTPNDTFGVEPASSRYVEFVDRHHPQRSHLSSPITDVDAFVIRTVAMHDFRRARLLDPDLPAQLLPPNWVRHRAFSLAVEIHQKTYRAASLWVRQFVAHQASPPPMYPVEMAGRLTS